MTMPVPVALGDDRFILGRLIWCGKDRGRGMVGGVLYHGQTLPVEHRDGAWHLVEELPPDSLPATQKPGKLDHGP